jgi:pimeloyl-ACP methyl ester carboxylesterase/protein-S-isoprenylcysteine O-methyltransferase Ste14
MSLPAKARSILDLRFKDFSRYIESKVLPIVFAYFILEQLAVFYSNSAGIAAGLKTLPNGLFAIDSITLVLFLIVRVLMILFNACVVIYLMKSPQAKVYHVERPIDVIVPMLSTFFILAANMLAYLPGPTNYRLLPASLDYQLSLLGLLLAIVGAGTSLLAIWHLGDSFSVFVQQRRIVESGPYRFFRHPIYLGHAIRMIGYWVMTTFTHHLVLTVVGIALLFYRARLEERRLQETNTTAYEKYRHTTDSHAAGVTAGLLAVAGLCIVFSFLRTASVTPPAATADVAQVEGPGLPVVFIHGAGGSKEVWSQQLEHLRQRRRAVALDLHRRDYSGPAARAQATIDVALRDIEATMVSLRVPRFVLVGHSMGSDYIIEYAHRHPEQVAGLLLVDPSGDYRWLPRQLKSDWLTRFEDTNRRTSIWAGLLVKSKPSTRRLVLNDLENTPEPIFRSLGSDLMSYDPATPFEAYRGPKLSVFSGCDENPDRPKNRFSPLPRRCMSGVSHWMMLDDPGKFNRILDEFLAAIPEEKAPRAVQKIDE